MRTTAHMHPNTISCSITQVLSYSVANGLPVTFGAGYNSNIFAMVVLDCNCTSEYAKTAKGFDLRHDSQTHQIRPSFQNCDDQLLFCRDGCRGPTCERPPVV